MEEDAANIEQQEVADANNVAAAGAPLKGRKPAAKNWSPEENLAVIRSARILGITGTESEKDKCWNACLSNLVAKDLKEAETRVAQCIVILRRC